MTQLRPTLVTRKNCPSPPLDTSLYLILQAVRKQGGLIHGRLEDGKGHFCAIGACFEDYSGTLSSDLIDEVAIVNDSMPRVGMATRRRRVLDWLQWKLDRVRSGK